MTIVDVISLNGKQYSVEFEGVVTRMGVEWCARCNYNGQILQSDPYFVTDPNKLGGLEESVKGLLLSNLKSVMARTVIIDN